MKDKLFGALGTFGVILWYIISFLYSFFPLVILRFNFWIDLILIAVMAAVPFAGEIVRLVLYVWAFIVVIGRPIDWLSIVFFVFAALYLFTTVIPFVTSLFSRRE